MAAASNAKTLLTPGTITTNPRKVLWSPSSRGAVPLSSVDRQREPPRSRRREPRRLRDAREDNAPRRKMAHAQALRSESPIPIRFCSGRETLLRARPWPHGSIATIPLRFEANRRRVQAVAWDERIHVMQFVRVEMEERVDASPAAAAIA